MPFVAAVFGIFALTFAIFFERSLPILGRDGLRFLFSWSWNPEAEVYGVASGLYGSAVTATLAALIATPLAVSLAVFVDEFVPRPVRRYLASFIDVMAGVPTIVFGLWGLDVLAPILFEYVERPLSLLIYGREPLTPYNYFTAAVMLATMVVPFATSVVREAYASIPETYREALYSLGATKPEAIKVLLGYVRPAIVAGVVLSFGRALGETAAVTLVIGNRIGPPSLNVFDSGVTVTSLIATQFPNAYLYDYAIPALFAAALALLLVGIACNLAAVRFTRRWVEKIGQA